MYCNCNCIKPILRSTAATVTDGNLTITLPNISTIENNEVIRFCVAQTIDYTNQLGTASISINGTTFPIKDKVGNDVRIIQLKPRRVYTVAVGAQTPNVIMLSCIPCSNFAYPVYAPPTTTTGA